MQNNALFEQIASDLLAAVEYIKEHPEQPKNELYTVYFIKFFKNELKQIRSSSFRKLLVEYSASAVPFRKYFIAGADGIKIEYEARFLRFGINIIVRTDDIKKLKSEFIKAVNLAFGAGSPAILVH